MQGFFPVRIQYRIEKIENGFAFQIDRYNIIFNRGDNFICTNARIKMNYLQG